MKMLCVVLAGLLLVAPRVMAQSSEIVVTGMGVTSISPDYATISFAIDAKKETADQAAGECALVYEKLVAALQGAGLSRREVITRSYRVDRWWDEKRRKPLGYWANHSLYISIKQLDRLGEFVDLMLASGIPEIQDITYATSKADSIRREALSAAVRNAREDAQVMAEAAGGKLGSLIELTTHYPNNPTFETERRVSAAALRSGVVRSLSITPQECTARITVLGRWKFTGSKGEG